MSNGFIWHSSGNRLCHNLLIAKVLRNHHSCDTPIIRVDLLNNNEGRIGKIQDGIDDLRDFADSLDCIEGLQEPMSLRLVHGRINDARRFSELLADIPGVSPKVFLSQLQRLEQDGILTRHVMATSPPTVEYALTHLGHELTPAIEVIVQVGHKLKRRSMP